MISRDRRKRSRKGSGKSYGQGCRRGKGGKGTLAELFGVVDGGGFFAGRPCLAVWLFFLAFPGGGGQVVSGG